MEKFYITTPIYYVNDLPHIGHTLTTVLADIFARYKKQVGFDVFFTTGTDEHGLKIKQAAEKAGQHPQEFADEVATEFKKAWQLLNIQYNYFIRTTNPKHKSLAQQFLRVLRDRGHIYKDIYEGLYCVGCEKFLTESDLDERNHCPLHKPEQTIHQQEENYFFKLAQFTPKVKQLIIEDKLKIVPSERKKEILARIEQGVEDISISREKLGWGVPIPWDKSQTAYVWVEALLNYWTIPQIVDKPYFWPPDLQTLGKEILWFHGVIWPAILLAVGEKLPQGLFAHSFFMIDGRKMSKSLGNVITPQQLVERYGVDATRYLLAKSVPCTDDSDVGLAKFDELYTADLANGLGNLIARVAALAEKTQITNSINSKEQLAFYPEVQTQLKKFRFDLALAFIWDKKIRELDRLIDKRQPWNLAGKKLQAALSDIITAIPQIAYNLRPFLPTTAQTIISQYSGKIKKGESLFPRLKIE